MGPRLRTFGLWKNAPNLEIMGNDSDWAIGLQWIVQGCQKVQVSVVGVRDIYVYLSIYIARTVLSHSLTPTAAGWSAPLLTLYS